MYDKPEEFEEKFKEAIEIVKNKNVNFKIGIGKNCGYPYDCIVFYNENKKVNIYWDDDALEWGICVDVDEEIVLDIRCNIDEVDKKAILIVQETFSL